MGCTAIGLRGHSVARPCGRARRFLLRWRFCLGFVSLLYSVVYSAAPLAAQNNQQLVYASNAQTSQIYGWVVNAVLGTLTAIPGSPFNERFDPYAIAVHPSGNFLYVINKLANDVSAFGIDANTGALTELATSPFAASCSNGGPCGTDPIAVVIDASGKFLCVLNATSDESDGAYTIGSLTSYSIDQNTGILTPADSIDLDSPPANPLALLADPASENLYVAGNNGKNAAAEEMLTTVSIDANSGKLSQASNAQQSFSDPAHSAAISPSGQFLYLGVGASEAEIILNGLSPAFAFRSSTTESYPASMAVDSTNSYLFAQIFGGSLLEFSINPSGVLTQLFPGPSPAISAGQAPMVADPNSPFLYFEDGSAYQISNSGALTALSGFLPSTGIGTYDPPSAPIQPVSGPFATFLPASLSFASQAVGTTSAAQQIALSSTGSEELIIGGVSLTGTNSADFTIQSSNCLPVLAPAAECSFMISYHPSISGNEQATLTVSDNVAGGASTAALTGSGFVPASAVTLIPGSLIFPTTTEGASSASMPVTVTNSGTAALHMSADAVLLTGSNPSDFSQTNTCNSATLAAQSSCTIELTFQPTAVGTRATEVQISDDAAGSPQFASLSGNGASGPVPAVTLMPGTLSFPATIQGTSSASQSILVTNSGTASLHIPATGVALSGTNPGDFSQTNSCSGSTVVVQASCVIMVSFQPTAAGTRGAEVLISDDAPNSPQSVSLSGSGVLASPPAASAVTLVPSSLNFPNAYEGVPSSAMSITVTNSGTAALNVSANGVILAGANPGDFSETDTCSASTVAIGTFCTIAVTFQPTAAGARTAQIQISDDAPNTPQTVSVSGIGVVPPFLLGPSASTSLTQTVSAGMAAQYNLQIAPQNGFTGIVSLACTGVPLNATCTVPSTLAISGASAVPFVVTVTTTASSLVPIFRGPWAKPASHEGIGWRGCFDLSMGLLFLLLVLCRRNPELTSALRNAAPKTATIVILLIVSVWLVSCAAGTASTTSVSLSTGTPSGSSTITVTASVGGVAQPFNLTLIVQ